MFTSMLAHRWCVNITKLIMQIKKCKDIFESSEILNRSTPVLVSKTQFTLKVKITLRLNTFSLWAKKVLKVAF